MLPYQSDFETISIHALREEGDLPPKQFYRFYAISIHALREEGDVGGCSSPLSSTTFLSTPSARRATGCRVFSVQDVPISIHALREEGDQQQSDR